MGSKGEGELGTNRANCSRFTLHPYPTLCPRCEDARERAELHPRTFVSPSPGAEKPLVSVSLPWATASRLTGCLCFRGWGTDCLGVPFAVPLGLGVPALLLRRSSVEYRRLRCTDNRCRRLLDALLAWSACSAAAFTPEACPALAAVPGLLVQLPLAPREPRGGATCAARTLTGAVPGAAPPPPVTTGGMPSALGMPPRPPRLWLSLLPPTTTAPPRGVTR